MPWTGLWTGLMTFGRILNSLQVAQERKEPGYICNDVYACNTSRWSCDYGCVWPCNVFGALGLIYWGSYARVEAYIYLCFVIRFW